MVDDRSAARRSLARETMNLTRDPFFRDGVLVRNEVGQHTVLHALHDDELGYVFDRLGEATPGAANLIVRMADQSMEIVALYRTRGQAPTEDADCPVTATSHVGMLVALLRQREGKPVQCRIVNPGYQAELAKPGRDQQPALA